MRGEQRRSLGVPVTLCLMIGSLLSGCISSDTSDLETYTRAVLARKGGQIEPLPEMKPYERYLYQSAQAGARDPFEPFNNTGQDLVSAKAESRAQTKYLYEIQERNREELEQFELDSLRMVGTLQGEKDLWGIVLDREGTVHRVRVGNYLGRNYGKVIHIDENQINLRELISDEQGGWLERFASLALIEE
jgi:type IV pilus assembly protein PilP